MIKYLYERFFKKEVKKEEVTKINLDEYNSEFSSIQDFDEDDYINKIFDDIFHSIMNTDDWDYVINSYEISIKNRGLEVKVEYTDLHKHFRIKNLRLFVFQSTGMKAHFTNNSLIFNYTDDLDIKFYKFVYNIYYKDKMEVNEKRKKKCDDVLLVVRESLGKSSIRDRKLDELLG